MEDSDPLKVLTELKFRNNLIPNLGEIIFVALIGQKETLKQLLDIKLDINKLLHYMLDKGVFKERNEVIKLLQEFINSLGGTQIEFEQFKESKQQTS